MNLRSRLSTLIAIRLVIGTLLLGWALLIHVRSPGEVPLEPLFFLIGFAYALSVVFLLTLRAVDRRPWLADAQLACDALLVTGLIGVTGGIASYWSSLYLLSVIAASTVRFRRGALQVATLSAILYVGLVSAQYFDAGPVTELVLAYSPALPSVGFAQYTVAANLLGFLAVALLSGSLAERLRRADARLERASHQIADLTAFNEHVIDRLHSGLATTDRDGLVLTFNRAGGAITGRLPGARAAIGQDINDVLQLPGGFWASLAALPEARSVRQDISYRTEPGGTVDIGLTVTTLRLPDGGRGFLFTFQDVTDVKRLERQVRLRQRLAALGEMAAGIAHEIRNPLASMSGSIQILRQDVQLSDEQAQLMDIVVRESDRLNETIRSFLAYATPQPLSVTRLDLRDALEDAAALLRNSVDVRPDHVIEVDVPPEPVWCEADGGQIRQIVWNLATNGLKAMPDGGRLRLALGTTMLPDRGSDIVLSVEDSGRGIPPGEIDEIFQPFRSAFEGGTGLGLAIVHRIVSDLNGTIQVSSSVETGTSMHVHLPAAPDHPVLPLGTGVEARS